MEAATPRRATSPNSYSGKSARFDSADPLSRAALRKESQAQWSGPYRHRDSEESPTSIRGRSPPSAPQPNQQRSAHEAQAAEPGERNLRNASRRSPRGKAPFSSTSAPHHALGRSVGTRRPVAVTIYHHLMPGARRRLGDTGHRTVSCTASAVRDEAAVARSASSVSA
jgi:hypothetical protein